MDRKKFIQNSMGLAVAGHTLIDGLYASPFIGPEMTGFPAIGIPGTHLEHLVLRPVMTNMHKFIF